MKNILIIAILFIGFTANAQSDSITKKHRHELGADVTGLLEQFVASYNNDPNSYYTPYTYTPVYYISYRYYLNKSNIRFGIGGNFSQTSVPGYTVNGVEAIQHNGGSNFSFRIGYEFTGELSKRWQAFYGIDYRPTFVNTDTRAQFSNAGYIMGYKEQTTVNGFAPLLGFRFRLSSRVSIITEASFSVNYSKTTHSTTYISTDNILYPDKGNDKRTPTKNIYASFAQPVFIILAVNI